LHIFIYIRYIQKYCQTAENYTPIELSLRTVKQTKIILRIAYLLLRGHSNVS